MCCRPWSEGPGWRTLLEAGSFQIRHDPLGGGGSNLALAIGVPVLAK